MARPKKNDGSDATSDLGQSLYDAYVHGAIINELAVKHKLETQEVVELIEAVERNRESNEGVTE